jgi:hypothetical protein
MAFLDKIASSVVNNIGKEITRNSGINFQIGEGGLSVSGALNNVIQKKMKYQNINSPIKELYEPNGGKTYQPIVYPSDLDNDHYIMFHIMKRKRPGINSAPTDRAIRTLVLPVPMNLQTAYGVNYENRGMGILGGMASGQLGVNNVVQAGQSLYDAAKAKAADLAGVVTNNVSDSWITQNPGTSNMLGLSSGGLTDANKHAGNQALAVGAGVGATAIGAAVGGAVGGILTAGALGIQNIGAGIMSSAGKAINPHMAVLFKDVGFRNFSFAYKLVARNQEESDSIKEMISLLKYHMHPALEDGTLTFGYPEEFEIEFSRTISPYLFKIHKSVLTGISVNYNGENMPLFFEDTQAPVSIELTMNFQETKILTKEDFRESGSAGKEGNA